MTRGILSDEFDKTQEPLPFQYHNGPLLFGKISINLIWYGNFKPSRRAIVSDFITSLTSPSSSKPKADQPSVNTWWKTIETYQRLTNSNSKKPSSLSVSSGAEFIDETYSLGKTLTSKHIVRLTSKGGQKDAVKVVLTAADVADNKLRGNIKSSKFSYIWVRNSETQCPGQCAWPFNQPIYGPQAQPLIAPNNDVGLDEVIINLASLLARTATNPFGNGYFQGPKEAPLEAGSACPGTFGKGAYPGYAGDLLVDPTTGAGYNFHGGYGRKYLLPALFYPSTSTCSTLV
ncbi:protein PHOSPHATE-INDUCED 1-like [Humulus lupulus]|uniref:protein PHOSPHATE-INDUCED 1-like n=1 Tax=Humulus lupulus TaxID=3486 RepID=UPI002B403179|nr:protein PHOSPHATE-INDUCED 1-like [Humulus lupulus]